jgi:hypothetical protein
MVLCECGFLLRYIVSTSSILRSAVLVLGFITHSCGNKRFYSVVGCSFNDSVLICVLLLTRIHYMNCFISLLFSSGKSGIAAPCSTYREYS